MVMPRTSRPSRGPRRRRVIGPARARMPALAATESPKPTEWARNGSASSRATTDSASTLVPALGRPSSDAVMAVRAIATARSTDGSQRVIAPNTTTTTTPRANRARWPRRRRAGAARASTNATLDPETASRCDRPEARNSSTVRSDTPLVSPRRNPASRLRCAAGREDPPASTRPRRALATRSSGEVGPEKARSRRTRNRPATCFQRNLASYPSAGSNQPSISTRSPAERTARRDAASPVALSFTRRPPAPDHPPPGRVNADARAIAETEKRSPAGSSASVARSRPSRRDATGPAIGDRARPCRARCVAAAPSSPQARSTATTPWCRGRSGRGGWARAHATAAPARARPAIPGAAAGPGPALSPNRIPARVAAAARVGTPPGIGPASVAAVTP